MEHHVNYAGMKVSSTVCRYEHWSTDWYPKWATRFGLPTHPTGSAIHRKHWEFCSIGQAFEERGLLRPGKRGVCFAAGLEFLPSAFANLGADILATDLASEGEWAGQHSKSHLDLFHPGMVSREMFDKHVTFQHADMTNIQGIEHGAYDFVWSSCAFEHLGSLDAGLDFVVNAMGLLKPGGTAIHTTEFNLSSNDETLTSGSNVIYRRRDIEALDHRLRKIRCGLERVDYDGGTHPFDLDYDSPPFSQDGRPHVKLELNGFISTSIIVIIHKGLIPTPALATGSIRPDRTCELGTAHGGDSQ